MANTERHSQPVVLTTPNGYKIPVQSLKAGATLLGRIYYRQTGITDFYLDYKGLQNMIKCGINNFHQGPLQGWSVDYYGKTDAEHWDLFLDEIGVEGSFRQSQIQLKTNLSSSQDQHEIKLSSSQDQVGFTTKQLSNISTNQLNNKATNQLNNKATEQLKLEDKEKDIELEYGTPEYFNMLKQKAMSAPVITDTILAEGI